MLDWRDQEATNQTLFRELNEWTSDASLGRRAPDHAMDVYVCECSDNRCSQPISLTRAEYEAVRAEPLRFAIALDHENPEIDHLVFENLRFATVDQFCGAGAGIARASNPRRS